MASSPRTRERRPSRIELAEKLTYGAVIVNVYILNMFMGTGPIALPYGFQVGGMLLSSLFLVFVAVTAYITGTFVVETLVITNVLFKFRDPENRPVFELVPTKNGKKVFRATDPEVWQITKRIEIGELGEVFFNGIGIKVTYFFMILYTLGTLTIYAVAVPQALQTMLPASTTVIGLDPYYLFLIGFAIIALPFCFGNFQNTKHLQVVVMGLRFLCFVCMIWASVSHMIHGKGAHSNLVVENDVKAQGLPWMLGNAICTFMIHHSIPGLVKPVKPQSSIKSAMFTASTLGLIAYLALCLTAIFAFGLNVNEIYNLNFEHFHWAEIAVFLQVYPILLVALYPLICITLRNNVINLVKMLQQPSSKYSTLAAGQDPVRTERLPSFASHGDNNLDAQLLGLEVDAADQIIPGLFDEDDLPSVKKQVAYTFLVALPPLLIAAVAHDVQIVRTITGAYPGLTVMFFIPCALVFLARRALRARVMEAANTASDLLSPSFRRDVSDAAEVENPQQSPFKSTWWVIVIVLIGVASAVYDTVDLIIS